MRNIPLSPTPSQTQTVVLGNINYQLNVFYKEDIGTFIDIYQAGVAILTSVLCRDRVRIVRDAYLGFNGDLSFIDTQGKSDPVYTGFGADGRYALAWLEPGVDV